MKSLLRLLVDLSGIILKEGSRGDVDLLAVFNSGQKKGGVRRRWVKRIAELQPSERLQMWGTAR